MRTLVFETLSLFFQSLPPDMICSWGKGLGNFLWYALPGRRHMATQAIKLHLQTTPRQAKKLARQSFVHSGQALLEIFLNHHLGPRELGQLITIDHPELFFSLAEAKRPIVAVTAHLGAWELLAPILAHFFTHRPRQIIIREPKNPALNQLLRHFRGHQQVQLIHRDQAAAQVLRCLKQGGLSAFLVDQNCGRSKAVFLRFFKKQAAVNMGPALLALRARALIWPVFLLRNKKQGYTLVPFSPLDTETLTGSREENLLAATVFYNSKVEEMVLSYPEQWFWMHNRWKTRPKWELEQ